MKGFNEITLYISLRHFFYNGRVIRLLLFLLPFFAFNNITAQPNPVSVDSRSLYNYGTNSSGNDAEENTDSVSLGSTTYYFYMPDTGTNDSFDYSDLFSGVTDTYTWTVPAGLAPAGAVSVAAHPAATYYKQITWSGGLGTGNIQVDVQTPAGCTNSYLAPVEVIALPSGQFIITDSSFCNNGGSDGFLGYSLNNIRINLSSAVKGNKNLKVNLTVACTNAGFGAIKNYTDIPVTQTSAGTGFFNMPDPLDYFGMYTITLTAINDRISTKCETNGTVGASSSYNFILSKVPSSIPLYHIKNEL